MPGRVGVVGGGISGLTTAYRLAQADPSLEVTVFEAGVRGGGKLMSVQVGGLGLPAAPDSFLARKPAAAELCRELGIELVPPGSSGTWLWTSHGLVPYASGNAFGIPGDVGDVFRWPGLTPRGRRRALLDLLVSRKRSEGDETLGSLLRRRLGDEATERALAPLLAGLFAGDVDRLSVRATFPELERWERSQGSLIRGAQAALREARKAEAGAMFLRPRGGVEAIAEALASKLGPALLTGARVEGIEGAAAAGWTLRSSDGVRDVDAVVLTAGASQAADLLRPVAPAAAAPLEKVHEVSTCVVLLVYPEGSADAFPEGAGFVVPRGAAPMTACTWHHQKWPSPEYGRRAILRCFVGAAGEEDVLDASDEEIVDACARHLAALLPLPDAPQHAAAVRWPRSMPQYELGHLDLAAEVRRELPPGIFVTGQSLDGVGISDCVRAAGKTAEEVAGSLATRRNERGTDL